MVDLAAELTELIASALADGVPRHQISNALIGALAAFSIRSEQDPEEGAAIMRTMLHVRRGLESEACVAGSALETRGPVRSRRRRSHMGHDARHEHGGEAGATSHLHPTPKFKLI